MIYLIKFQFFKTKMLFSQPCYFHLPL